MKRIGITGGIGSGKTTVCKIFELLGVPVYYADDMAKNILDQDPDVLKRITDTFGTSVLNDSGKIDKKKLAAVVFNSSGELARLNAIVHPAVAVDFERWCDSKKDSPYILKEAAILFESGAHKNVDQVIAVIAPIELRIQRIVTRDKFTEEEIMNRISKQMSDDEKRQRSAFVITNDEKEMVIPQVLRIHNELTAF
jgi:dephospho-CoA kinase